MFDRVSLFIIILKLGREFFITIALQTFMPNYFRQSTQTKHILDVDLQIQKG